MSLSSGGEQPKIRDGYNPTTGQIQPMQDTNGIQKGMETILKEQKLWRYGLKAQCRIDNPDKTKKTKHILNPQCLTGYQNCCARGILSGQDDFKAQRSQIQEVIEDAGHSVLFYPKFHCELNWYVHFINILLSINNY